MKHRIKIAISLVYWMGVRLVAAVERLFGGAPPATLVILYYHSVPKDRRPGFAGQMSALQRRAIVVPANTRERASSPRPMVAITFDDAFVSVIESALPELADRGMHCTIFVPTGVLGRRPDWAMEEAGDPAELVASCEQLKTLAGPLVTLGAHSVTHPFLTQASPAEARWEIKAARDSLSSIVGLEVDLFAFPYGDFDEAILDMCRDEHYSHAFSIVPRPVDLAQRAFLRGRVSVDPSDGRLEFFLKSSGAYAWMPLASRAKRSFRSSIRRLTSGRPGVAA